MPVERGKVYLVGAGPGDAGLLTRKGEAVLQKADIVYYDRLVHDTILALLPDHTCKVNVGKNAGNHPVPQETINRLLLESALEGKTVVRLKGGDPFLFGRGGEELELLVENGVAFEVVPGVTSAIAAPAYAGIPVTHRDYCSSLHIITGHGRSNSVADIQYESLVNLGGTLIFMMSVRTMPVIVQGLLEAGMDPGTPASVIENGTRYEQRRFSGELKNIVEIAAQNALKPPAVFIVGGVCALAAQFDWFTEAPLRGCRVLVTRPKKVAGKLAGMLEELGARVTLLPCIRRSPLAFELNPEPFDWLLFTSAFGVDVFFREWVREGKDSRSLHGKKVAAVGSETAAALMEKGISADFVPHVFDGDHLASGLLESGLLKEGERIGVYRAQDGAKEWVSFLRERLYFVEDIAVYETQYSDDETVCADEYDYVTFTSSSCVHAFVRIMPGQTSLSGVKAVCIGRQTAEVAKNYGMEIIVSENATVRSVVDKIVEVHHANQTAALEV